MHDSSETALHEVFNGKLQPSQSVRICVARTVSCAARTGRPWMSHAHGRTMHGGSGDGIVPVRTTRAVPVILARR